MIRPVSERDKPWIKKLLKDEWTSEQIVTRGKIHDASQAPGFIAEINEQTTGLITYVIENNQMEALTLNVVESARNRGVGTQLLNSLIAKAKKLGLKRIWGITTNDNLEAIQFYKNRGFRIAATYLNAIALSRKLKPEIPEIGLHGIPIRDEIEIEHSLTD